MTDNEKEMLRFIEELKIDISLIIYRDKENKKWTNPDILLIRDRLMDKIIQIKKREKWPPFEK